jgi:hypothetical protein
LPRLVGWESRPVKEFGRPVDWEGGLVKVVVFLVNFFIILI